MDLRDRLIGRPLGQAMESMSAFGERHGIDALTYNPLRMRMYHRYAARDAPAVMRAFARIFPNAHRYADVGAGSGAFAAEARRSGRVVWACEHSRAGRAMARMQSVRSIPFDLAGPVPAELPRDLDLAYSFEVAEHVPPDLGDRLVRFVGGLAPVVVFTAAHPGQGGTGHINEQPQSYWIERFEADGRHHDRLLSRAIASAFADEGVEAPWLLENVMAFRSAPARPAARAQARSHVAM